MADFKVELPKMSEEKRAKASEMKKEMAKNAAAMKDKLGLSPEAAIEVIEALGVITNLTYKQKEYLNYLIAQSNQFAIFLSDGKVNIGSAFKDDGTMVDPTKWVSEEEFKDG